MLSSICFMIISRLEPAIETLLDRKELRL